MIVTYEDIINIINYENNNNNNNLNENENLKENLIIDTRNKESFYHMNIPGSISIPYKSFINNDNTFKTKEEILEIVDSYEIKSYKNVINYCGIGLTASINSFVLKEILGLENIKLYSGSMEEYSQNI
jgi:thiosulfate/3-mercaptopyruvate sulfurtransferase